MRHLVGSGAPGAALLTACARSAPAPPPVPPAKWVPPARAQDTTPTER